MPEALEPALDGKHRTEDGTVAGIPANPGAEDVFPDHDAAAVHPGGVQLAGVTVIPAFDLVLEMARFKPLVAEDTGHVAVGEPLRPGEMMIVHAFDLQGQLALERDTGPGGIQESAEFRRTVGQRVEEDPIHIEGADEVAEHLEVGHGLAARAGVPGIVDCN
jgi:hypothetical protein